MGVLCLSTGVTFGITFTFVYLIISNVCASNFLEHKRILSDRNTTHLLPFFSQVQELFRVEYGEVFHVQVPTIRERRNFFEDLILNQASKAPASKKKAGEK